MRPLEGIRVVDCGGLVVTPNGSLTTVGDAPFVP